MREAAPSTEVALALPLALRVDQLCHQFEEAWKAGQRPCIDDYLADLAEPAQNFAQRELLALEIIYRCRAGESPQAEEYHARFPSLDPALLSQLLAASRPGAAEQPAANLRAGPARLRCPHCGNPIQLRDQHSEEVLCPGCGGYFWVRDTQQTTTASGMRPVGKFQLLERVGVGAFGAVWKARDTELDRLVALKIAHTGLLGAAEDLERFHREARAAGQLRHPGIVSVHEVVTLDGLPTIVADYIEGESLKDLLAERWLSFREAAGLLAEVAEAVDYAHSMGLVHRDLKPANILLESVVNSPRFVPNEPRPTEHGLRPRVTDFGLASRQGAEITLTLEGQIVGTPAYMSPEQAAGKGHQADRRSDVYSLGVILYELLCGELPFRGSRAMLLSQVLWEEPRPPRRLNDRIPRDLETICLKALAKEPGRRYATAREFAADLRRFLMGEPIRARPVRGVEKAWHWCQRNPVVAGLIAMVFLVTTAGFAATFGQMQKANARAAELRQTLYYQAIALAEREWSMNDLSRVEELLDACPADLRDWEWRYLKRLPVERMLPLRHPAAVLCAEFSPDGKWIVSGGQDGVVRVWDGTTGKYQYEFKAHEGHVRHIAFSLNGRFAATASWDGTAKIWDFGRESAGGAKSPLHILLGHQERVHTVAFSPDNLRLATGGDDDTVRIWDTATGRLVFPLRGHTAVVACVAYSPDGQYVASGSHDNTLIIWDAKTGVQKYPNLMEHRTEIQHVSFSRDGRLLASASNDGEIRVWDVRTGTKVRTLRGHTDVTWCVQFNADSQRLASAGGDETVKLWDLRTGQEVLTLRGHSGHVKNMAFSPDGNRIVSASADRTVRVWNATPLEGEASQAVVTFRGHQGPVRCVTFSPDGRHLVSAGNDETVKFWDFKRGLAADANPVIHSLPGCNDDIVIQVAFRRDGRCLAYGGGGKLKVWDTIAMKEILEIPNAGSPLAFSPDGRYLAAGGRQAGLGFSIKIHDATTGREIHSSLTGHSWAIKAVVFNPDPGFACLASASADGTIRIWDVTTGKEIAKSPLRHSDGLMCVAFSQDGRLLASGGDEKVVRIWDTHSWQILRELPDPTGRVESVVFHPKVNRVLAWGSSDGTVKIWNTATNDIHKLYGHKRSVTSVAFSPDGEWIASASQDGTVKVWEAPPLAELTGQVNK